MGVAVGEAPRKVAACSLFGSARIEGAECDEGDGRRAADAGVAVDQQRKTAIPVSQETQQVFDVARLGKHAVGGGLGDVGNGDVQMLGIRPGSRRGREASEARSRWQPGSTAAWPRREPTGRHVSGPSEIPFRLECRKALEKQCLHHLSGLRKEVLAPGLGRRQRRAEEQVGLRFGEAGKRRRLQACRCPIGGLDRRVFVRRQVGEAEAGVNRIEEPGFDALVGVARGPS